MFGFERSFFRHRRMAFLLSLIASPLVNAANLGLDGAWFNPAQSGHGLTLAQATDTTMVGIWHTYDAAGNALTLYADLTLEGDVLSGTAYAPKGMRFGSFNPNDLQMPVWGEISLKVGQQCRRLTLSWQSALPTYGNGETSLVRLAGGANQTCAVQSSDYQLLSGSYMSDNTFIEHAMVFGAIDGDGKLWALQTSAALGVYALPLGSSPGTTLVAERGTAVAALWAGSIAGTQPHTGGSAIDGHSSFDAIGNESILFNKVYAVDGGTYQRSWLLQASTNAPLPLRSINDLAGEYVTQFQLQVVGGYLSPVVIDATGQICIRQLPSHSECQWSGQAVVSGADGMFDFTVSGAGGSPTYVGRGWKQNVNDAGSREYDNVVVMVGRDQNGNGFGMAAY
jgi:hypothetical protein